METKPTLHKTIYNNDVEVYLNNIENELFDFADIQGKQDGQKDTEPTEGIYKINVTDPVRNKVQLAIDFIRKTLLSTSIIIGAAETDKAAQKQIQANKNHINDKAHKKASINRKMGSLAGDPQKQKYAKWLIVVAVFVGIADAALAYGSFRHGAYTALQATLAALAIGAVISLSHLLYAGWIKESPNKNVKIFRTLVILMVAFTFFAWIGNLRAGASNNTVSIALEGNNVIAASTPQLNGWAIAIISFVLFVAVFFLSLLFWRSKKERQDEQEYNRLKSELDKIDTEVQKLEKDNIAIEANATAEKQEARKIYDYATSSIRRAKSIGVNTITKYMQVYARFHNNVPKFFEYKNEVVYDESFHFPKPQNAELV